MAVAPGAAVAGRERRGAAAPAARPRVRRRRGDAPHRRLPGPATLAHGARLRARRRSRSSRSSARPCSRCGPGAAPTAAGWFASLDRHRARQPAPLRRVRRAHRRGLHRGRARGGRARSARSRRCGCAAGESATVGGYTVTFVGTRIDAHRPEERASRPTSQLEKGGETSAPTRPRSRRSRTATTAIGTPSVRTGILEDVYLTIVSSPNEQGRITVGVADATR